MSNICPVKYAEAEILFHNLQGDVYEIMKKAYGADIATALFENLEMELDAECQAKEFENYMVVVKQVIDSLEKLKDLKNS